MTKLRIAAVLATCVAFWTGAAFAAQDHSQLVNGPFRTGPEVTKQCLQCHQSQAEDFMKTVHWTWSSRQKAGGKEITLGKVNAVNNFCIALPTNEPRCTSCHAGYGWKDASFDFGNPANIDCLVCHDTTGTYAKFPAGAGHPAYEPREFPPKSGKVWKPLDLEKIAKSVGPTSRATCGACHFFGGGGDHVKHGDLDSSMAKPPRTMDVHMAVDGADMACSTCHRARDHQIPGKALAVSVSNRVIGATLDCTDCHAGRAHKANVILDRHTVKVACQACHVPTFARTLPTKVRWDWSTAGRDITPPVDQYGLKTYDRQKGDFTWAKDVVPTYAWFDGNVSRVLLGDKVDPSGVVHLASPQGKRGDANAKITPFKVMRGKQPIDAGNNVMAVPHLFGKGGYWDVYDWNVAVRDGMKAVGLPFSGQLGWAETDMYWKVNHMVVPKEKALGCNDCHGANQTRMDWKALGYERDPREAARRAAR